ncbi:MAG TPA: SPFH domain-containing protein [Kofleriaceae bacterium]|nr:SPFH domain-containing protein [Kofleriaceae bacterium]
MRYAIGLVLVLWGCGGTVIEPGHLGLVFDPKNGGLHHEVLQPGYHRVGGSARVLDYDVTYSTRTEPMTVLTAENVQIEVKFSVIYRPIIAELYQLEADVGPRYYDEVIGPELRSAAREELAKHSVVDLAHDATTLETAIEVAVRRRIAGKHVELASVDVERIALPPELVAAIRTRETAEQNALREKTELERAALRDKLEADEKWEKEKLELEHDVERRQLKRQADGK